LSITFVGSNTQVKNDGNAISMSLPASAQGDLVVVFTACRDESKGGSPVGGYTEIANMLYTGANALRFHASYKFMGAIQDTLVGVPGTGTSTGLVAIALVFGGASTSSPLDVVVTTNLAGTGIPIAPAITPTNNDCCIVIAAANGVVDTSVGAVSGYLPSPSVQMASGIGTTVTAATAYKILTGGASTAQTPTTWSTWSTGSWVAITIALRPDTAEIDFNTVDPGTVTTTGKAVAEAGTLPVSSATVTYTGKTVATPDGLVESIFVDPAMDIMLVGKAVESTETFRAVEVTKAAVLYRGRTVTPREIQFEDIPRYAVKGRGSGVWMETR
jgi:hypothetical protein